MKFPRFHFHPTFSAAVATVAISMSSLLHAATFTWTGSDAVTGSWAPSSGNWNPTPTFNNTADLVFNDLNRATANEIGANRTVRSITFGDNIDGTWTTNMTTAAVLTFAADSGNASLDVSSGSTANITFNGGTGITGSQSLTSQLEVDHNGSGLLTFNRQTAGAGGITKTGTGTLVLTGFNANTFTGPLNVNGGQLILNNTQGTTQDLAAAVAINLGGGTLESRTTGTFGKVLSQNITVSSASSLAYNNTTSTSRTLTLQTGAMALNANLTVQNISSDQTLSNHILINREMTGSGDLIVETYNNVTSSTANANFALGRVALGGNNTGWSGDLVIRQGTAQLFGDTALGQFNLGSGDIILGETGNSFGAGLLLGASTPTAGSKTLNNDIIVRSNGFRTIRGGSDHTYNLNGDILLQGDLNIHNGLFFTDKGMILNGDISGVGGLSITESGNPSFTRLTGNNTYSGATTIGAGAVLNILSTSGNAIGDSSAVVFSGAGSALVFNSTNETVGSISSSGSDGVINLGVNTLTTGGNHQSTTYGGTIDGAGGLTKVGSGTMETTNINGFTGALRINEGKFIVGSTGTINGTSGVSIGAGEFRYNSSTALSRSVAFSTTGGTLSGTGPITSDIDVTAGNHLAVGNGGIGSMSFNGALMAAGTFLYEIHGGTNAADRVDVAGILTLGGVLDLVQLGTYSVGDKFTLLAYGGPLSGNFSGIADDTDFIDGGGTWTLNYNDTSPGLNGGVSANNTFVTITAIPEPDFALLFGGLGTLGLLLRRRA